MALTIITPRESETAGLASGYQRTSVTSSAVSVVSVTGGNLLISVPTTRHYQPLIPVEPLEVQMQQSLAFLHLVQRGLTDLQQGRYSRIEEVKRRLGDI